MLQKDNPKNREKHWGSNQPRTASDQRGAAAAGVLIATVSVSATILIALSGFFLSGTKSVERDLRATEAQASTDRERITVVETKIDNIEDDVSEIKGDVKSLLKAFNVKSPQIISKP